MRRLPRQLQGERLITAAAFITLAALASEPDAANGAVLAGLSGCASCHTAKGGAPYAGGYALNTKFGTYYGPNITPDPEDGIGGWSEAQFARALHEGRDDEGHRLSPAFPYGSFTHLTDADVADLYAFLRTVPAAATPSIAHEPKWPYGWTELTRIWRGMHFHEGPIKVDPDRSASYDRGEYLVRGPGHCGECHTPRSSTGGMKEHKFLAGNRAPPEPSPNITPSTEGIGDFSAHDLASFLTDGMDPDGNTVGGAMLVVVRDGTARLSDADRAAIAEFLLAQKPHPKHGKPEPIHKDSEDPSW